jgi:nitrate/nitrite transporter NarK
MAVSGAIGNPVAGELMKTLNGRWSLHGWQWMFLLEGVPPVVMGLAILLFNLLPERPANAGWLTAVQQQWLEDELERDRDSRRAQAVSELRLIADGRLLLLSLIYFLMVVGVYGFVYFMPTLVKSVTGGSDATVGWWAGLPYLFAGIGMVAVGANSDRRGRPRWHTAFCSLLGAIGMAGAAESTHTAATMTCLSLAAIGVYGQLAPFWAIPTRYLRDVAAAGGIAVINSIGNLGGFFAPSLIGWAKDRTGTLTAGLLVAAGSLLAASILVLCVPSSVEAPPARRPADGAGPFD